MTDKELRGLNRAELLELLIKVSKENDELKAQINGLKTELADREIKIENAGSIAEASLAINGVFEAAQAAAKQYLDNMEQCELRHQEKCRQTDEEAKAIIAAADDEARKKLFVADNDAKKMVSDADAEAKRLVTEAEQKAKTLTVEAEQKAKNADAEAEQKLKSAEAEAAAMTEKAKRESEAYWTEVTQKLDNYISEYKGLRELLNMTAK